MLFFAWLWPGVAGAVTLGWAVGFLAGWPERRAVSLGLAGLALVLLVLALAQVVPGVPGFWLDGAAMMLPAYLAGCALGAMGNPTSGAER